MTNTSDRDKEADLYASKTTTLGTALHDGFCDGWDACAASVLKWARENAICLSKLEAFLGRKDMSTESTGAKGYVENRAEIEHGK